ncbi:MAG TPA: glycoside hydrolase family 71/99-like protein [Fimbriimonadaceae bacterium]|nr:glycoside hydrolase family 71/99-like protein [Fimbriimonadaceae bacterium]
MLLAALLLTAATRPLLMAHYMPWFQAPPVHSQWGWHWTMNVKEPARLVDGVPDVAAHVHPLLGPYDSSDPAVLECQAALMKLAGIDGVFIDWYGNVDCDDYMPNHLAASRFIEVAAGSGLKFSLVYEDRTVPNLIKHGKTTPSTAVQAGNALMRWVDEHWFSRPEYLRLGGKPVFVVFGPEYYKHSAWDQVFAGLKHPPAFFTLDSVQAPGAGTFGWPQPQGGMWQEKLDSYYKRAKAAPVEIAPAFPRFSDFYRDAGVGESNGEIPDAGGKTYTRTLDRALASGSPIIQLITWNDYGEGTVIEPSVEFGFKALEQTQAFRRRLDPSFAYTPEDLRLPVKLLRLRRAGGDARKLDRASALLLRGEVAGARRVLGS